VLTGFSSKDEMCVNGRNGNSSKQECVKEYEFFTVTNMSTEIYAFDESSGELGLGFDQAENGDSFITSLKKNQIIDQEVVTVHLDTGLQNSQKSVLTIGGNEPNLLYGDGSFKKYKASGDKWSVEVRGHMFLNKSTELDYKMTGKVDSF
jgi:hypothetical protein